MTRNEIKFDIEDYERIIKKYQVLKEVRINGIERKPLMQEIKSMFMSERTVDDIISCMEWMARDEFYQTRWTMRTIRLKLPEYLAGKLKSKVAEAVNGIIPPHLWKKN